MNEELVQRVKISLSKQFYCMNYSWLQDCIDYFFQDNQNPTQEEIITFVKNQWQLSDLREINNENGSLPNNLTSAKCTTLTGRYILQMEKIFDISQSKYKQLEKIRQVSSENVEATENENTNQDDKFQAWEPKSKRMLQLFLTDGICDITAIEYKPIRFLKDNLFPGYKLLIKGPVICRRGVLLLEETNISEVGGEVDSLLIVNAVENIFARALKLQENPDPYNDVNKQVQSENGSRSTNFIEDDFDLDSQSIAQIEKQLQMQNYNNSKNSNASTKNTVALHEPQSVNSFGSNKNKIIKETIDFEDDDDSFLEMVDEKAFQDFSTPNSSVSQKYSVNNKPSTSRIVQSRSENDFPTEDELNEFEQSAFYDNSKSLSVKSNLACSPGGKSKSKNTSQKSPSKSKNCENSLLNTQPSSMSRNTSKLSELNKISKISNTTRESPKKKSCKNSLFKFPSSPPKFKNSIKSSESIQKNAMSNSTSKSPQKNDYYSALSNKTTASSISNIHGKASTSRADDFSEDDFNIDNFNISTDFSDSFGTNVQTNLLSSKSNHTTSPKSSIKSNDAFSSSKKAPNNKPIQSLYKKHNVPEILDTQLRSEFNEDFEKKMDIDYSVAHEKQKSKISETTSKNSPSFELKLNNDSLGQTGIKRLASEMSPREDTTSKKSCSQSTPDLDGFSDPEVKAFIKEALTITEDTLIILDLLHDVLEYPLTDEGTKTVVRGIVTNIVKLNLVKKDNKHFFHLEGTITDYTAELEVVFSSKVLEKIIGMTTQEFSQKRKLGKINPEMKNQLREDLQKAQEVLRNLDVLMELELKKNEKASVMHYVELTDKHKRVFDEKVKKHMKQKYKR